MLCDQVFAKIGAAVPRPVVVAVVIVSLSSQHASAAPLTITVETLTALTTGLPLTLTPSAQLLPDGSFNYDGQNTTADWAMSWYFNADPDPHFTSFDARRYDFQGKGVFDIIDDGLVELTNASGLLTSYMVSFDVPGGSLSPLHVISAGVAAAVEGGQLGRHQNGHPLMQILIDGSPQAKFFDGDFTVDDMTFLVDETPLQFFHSPILNGFAVQLAFSLSPGATVHLLPQFEAIPVPEPGTGILLILGLIAMLVVRRR